MLSDKELQELRRLETRLRMEQNIEPEEGESVAMTSLAVSFARIADLLDKRPAEEREAGLQGLMLAVLEKRGWFLGKRPTSLNLAAMVKEYFEQR